jgi:predicted nucleic acid-binding protein
MAVQLIEQLPGNEVVLPAQTLGELSRVLTAKAKRSAEQTREAVLSWADSFEVADSTWFAFQSALDLTVDHQLPIWDALVLAVAAESRCRLLLSEDFHNGFTWRGVTVANPFVEPRSPLLSALLRTTN